MNGFDSALERARKGLNARKMRDSIALEFVDKLKDWVLSMGYQVTAEDRGFKTQIDGTDVWVLCTRDGYRVVRGKVAIGTHRFELVVNEVTRLIAEHEVLQAERKRLRRET